MAPVTSTRPDAPAFKVSDWVLAVLPLTAPLIVNAPLPVRSVKSSFNTSAVSLSPRVMAVLLVPTVPPKLRPLGAAATKPPSKARLSLAALPNVTLPVFKKVVAPLTCVLPPTKARW